MQAMRKSKKNEIGINQASAIVGRADAGVRSREVAKATHFVRLLWPPGVE